ncbi:piggyBac transposable element-derived protein 4-like [Schistocerca nitens]|uniref:piggyBac transposable element-derived protein 4-like n=1 Tax=Schistocerca nitens TaxID=7011 RepID=UPI002117F4D6|nr:piggyBac transposable element-derived protein 4-like [Schistocerca nitens]
MDFSDLKDIKALRDDMAKDVDRYMFKRVIMDNRPSSRVNQQFRACDLTANILMDILAEIPSDTESAASDTGGESGEIYEEPRLLLPDDSVVEFEEDVNESVCAQRLKKQGIYACGTVRKGRVGFPKDLENEKNMYRGEFQFHCSGQGITAFVYKDRKPIQFPSHFYNTVNVDTASRKSKDGSRTEISCPDIVKDYNTYMGLADKSDMLKSIYEIDRKSKKWWHRILWHFLDVTVVNACIIYNEHCDNDQKTLKQFTLSVIAGLVGETSSSTPNRKRSQIQRNKFEPFVAPEKRFDSASHMPEKGPPRRCAHCSTAKEPHRTRSFCKMCNVGLCLTKTKNCFTEFHKKM